MTGTSDLPACEYRAPLADEGVWFCRHTSVRTADGLVNEEICRGCCQRERPCPSPRSAPRTAKKQPPVHVPSPSNESGPPNVEAAVTIGIVTFNRPRSLLRLIHSIRDRYRRMPIVVADNGNQPADVAAIEHVRYLKLPFDCGLSASRNRLIDVLESPFLLVLDDDFEFTDETAIERFLEVLDCDPEVGVVGGPLYHSDALQLDYACDLRKFRDRLSMAPSTGPWRITPGGVPYQLVDQILNFALFRREMLAEHRWDEHLKLHEHEDFFLAVQEAGNWRVAFCDAVKCHHRQERSADYKPFRDRAQQFQPYVHAKWGVRGFDASPAVLYPTGLHPPEPKLPNLLVLRTARSRTQSAIRFAESLGWQTIAGPDAGELHVVSRLALATGEFDVTRATRALDLLPRPCILDEPLLLFTFDKWLVACSRIHDRPMLVWLSDESTIAASADDLPPGISPQLASELAARAYRRWPWQKLKLDAARILETLGG